MPAFAQQAPVTGGAGGYDVTMSFYFGIVSYEIDYRISLPEDKNLYDLILPRPVANTAELMLRQTDISFANLLFFRTM
jgi:hypothetical protein